MCQMCSSDSNVYSVSQMRLLCWSSWSATWWWPCISTRKQITWPYRYGVGYTLHSSSHLTGAAFPAKEYMILASAFAIEECLQLGNMLSQSKNNFQGSGCAPAYD